MRQTRYFAFILLSIIFQASGWAFSELVAQTTAGFSVSAIISNSYYQVSLALLLLQAIVWQQALKHYPLSYAYPMMSLVNFLVLFIAAFYFAEQVTILNVVGLSIISFGVLLLSQSEEKK